MAAEPRPANDHAPVGPSLFDRALGAARNASAPPPVAAPARTATPRDRRTIVTAMLLVAGPLATWVGALWLTGTVRRETAVLEARAAPRVAARAETGRARSILQAAWAAPTIGTTIEAVARAMPPDAMLLRIEQPVGGGLRLEVAAPDPDRLIAALRRDPALAGLRATAQVPGDGTMRVTLERTG